MTEQTILEPSVGTADIAGQMMNAGMYSSNKQDWETPQYFVNLVERKFNVTFDLDACCYPETAKAPRYFTEEDNALVQDWCTEEFDEELQEECKRAATVWMNPPYGRALPTWTQKALSESRQWGSTVFCLVPGRTDTEWFHEAAQYGKLILMKKRLPFLQGGQEQGSPAFPSVLIIFGQGTGVEYWDWKVDLKAMLEEQE